MGMASQVAIPPLHLCKYIANKLFNMHYAVSLVNVIDFN